MQNFDSRFHQFAFLLNGSGGGALFQPLDLCIVEYGGRFGFDTISILELKGSGFVQTDIGKQIDKSLEAAIAKQSHDPERSGGDATPHFRIGANRKVRVGTVSTTDPKQLNEKGGYSKEQEYRIARRVIGYFRKLHIHPANLRPRPSSPREKRSVQPRRASGMCPLSKSSGRFFAQVRRLARSTSRRTGRNQPASLN